MHSSHSYIEDLLSDEHFISWVKHLNKDRDSISLTTAGHPIGALYTLVFEGIWQLDEADQTSKFGLKPGDTKYINQISKISTSEWGTQNPGYLIHYCTLLSRS